MGSLSYDQWEEQSHPNSTSQAEKRLTCACAYVLRQELFLWAWLKEQITWVHPSPPSSSNEAEFLTPLSPLPPHPFLCRAPIKQPLFLALEEDSSEYHTQRSSRLRRVAPWQHTL